MARLRTCWGCALLAATSLSLSFGLLEAPVHGAGCCALCECSSPSPSQQDCRRWQTLALEGAQVSLNLPAHCAPLPRPSSGGCLLQKEAGNSWDLTLEMTLSLLHAPSPLLPEASSRTPFGPVSLIQNLLQVPVEGTSEHVQRVGIPRNAPVVRVSLQEVAH